MNTILILYNIFEYPGSKVVANGNMEMFMVQLCNHMLMMKQHIPTSRNT
jgi:hypothetical protein